MTPSNAKYDLSNLDKLKEADWDDVFPRVVKYAHRKCVNYSLLGFDFDPEVLVEEAIARAYGCGTSSRSESTFRNWNQDAYPDLASFLISIIKSMLNHLTEHHAAFRMESFSDDESDEFDKPSKFDLEAQNSSFLTGLIRPKTPEEQLVLNRQMDLFRTFLNRLSSEDEEIGMVLMAYEDGAEKPADVSEITGIDIDKVYNINKRLNRRILGFLKENDMNGWERIAR